MFVAGETVIAAVVAPVFHAYVPTPDAVSVVDCPEQIVLFPEMEAVGAIKTFTVTVAVSVHPFTLDTETV